MSIHIRELSRIYRTGSDRVVALDKLNLRIEPGELTAIMGPSGSGKSTVLNMCSGLDTPTSGEVVVLDTIITQKSPRAKISFRRDNVGVVFQDNNLIQEFNTTENIMLPLLARGIKPYKAIEITNQTLENLGIKELSKRFPHEMSGGQIQRVGIARAIAGDKKILLADEPTGSLDSKSTRAVFSVLKNLSASKSTVLVATHDPTIEDFADRIVEIIDGKIVSK